MDDYTVAWGETVPELVVEVMKWAEEGYAVQGGICAVYNQDADRHCFYQAMIKYAQVRLPIMRPKLTQK